MGESSPKPLGPSLPIKADRYSQLLLAEVPQDNRHKWAWPRGVISVQTVSPARDQGWWARAVRETFVPLFCDSANCEFPNANVPVTWPEVGSDTVRMKGIGGNVDKSPGP